MDGSFLFLPSQCLFQRCNLRRLRTHKRVPNGANEQVSKLFCTLLRTFGCFGSIYPGSAHTQICAFRLRVQVNWQTVLSPPVSRHQPYRRTSVAHTHYTIVQSRGLCSQNSVSEQLFGQCSPTVRVTSVHNCFEYMHPFMFWYPEIVYDQSRL